MATLSWPTVYTGGKRKTYTGTAKPELQLINSVYTLRAVKRVLVCLHKELGLGAQAVNHGNRGIFSAVTASKRDNSADSAKLGIKRSSNV